MKETFGHRRHWQLPLTHAWASARPLVKLAILRRDLPGGDLSAAGNR